MSHTAMRRTWADAERVAALYHYGILDTEREVEFDNVATLAARILDAPIAAVNLIDQNRQWFKAEIGLGVREMPLDDSICKFAMLEQDRMIVSDTLADIRFSSNPLVTGAPGLRFYAGELLKTPEGVPLGTLCVLDTKPRPHGLTEEQQFALRTLSQQIMSQLELRKLLHQQRILLEEKTRNAQALERERDRVNRVLEGMDEGYVFLDQEFRVREISAGGLAMDGRPFNDIVGRTHWEVWPGSEDLPIASAYRRAMDEQVPISAEQRYGLPGGADSWLEIRAYPVPDGLAIFYRDISDRKRSMALADGQRTALELAVSDAPIQDVLEVLVRSAEEQLGHASTISILLLEAGRLRHGAAPSLPDAYIKAIDGAAIGPSVGSCGTAAYLNEEVTVSDIDTDPLWADFRDLALAHGLRSCWSQPIRSPQGQVLGTMACYRHEPHVPTDKEKATLSLLVNTTALVLDHRRETDERKATQEALHRNEQRFRSLVTATSQILWTTNAEGFVVEDSPSWRAFTGQTYDEWKHHGWLDVLHPDDKERTLAAWKRCLDRQEIFQVEYRVRRADGSFRWTSVRGVPVLNEDGTIREWVGANTDINEHKNAEIERQRFVSLAERSNDFIGMADLSLQPFFVNRSGLAMLGLDSLEQALKTPITDFFFAEDRSFIVTEFLPKVLELGSSEVEIRFKHFKTGEALWVIYSVYGVEDGNGKIIGYATVSRNVTERKEAEEELQQLAGSLAEANRRKTEFLATLAHELRNPLAPIRNGLEVMRLSGNNPAMATKVREMMQRQVDHLVHLVNDLLDVARINSGKVELKKEMVEFKDIVASALEASMPQINAAHHMFDLDVVDLPLLVYVDRVRLHQVLANLLTNAAKYTPEGGQITLAVRSEDGHVVFTVSDTGIGIPADSLPTVFEMFAQLPNNIGRTQGGLGIGLTLVQRLVEMHGGTVSASSPGEGKGSTFTVHLPLLALEIQNKAGQPDAVSAATERRVLRILVADDNADAAESLGIVLQLAGHETIVAYDGPEALKLVLEHRPDVVFLDIGMPGLNGYDVAALIRKTPGMETTILVALTGWGTQDDKITAKQAGFDHHVTKPADLQSITTLLYKF